MSTSAPLTFPLHLQQIHGPSKGGMGVRGRTGDGGGEGVLGGVLSTTWPCVVSLLLLSALHTHAHIYLAHHLTREIQPYMASNNSGRTRRDVRVLTGKPRSGRGRDSWTTGRALTIETDSRSLGWCWRKKTTTLRSPPIYAEWRRWRSSNPPSGDEEPHQSPNVPLCPAGSHQALLLTDALSHSPGQRTTSNIQRPVILARPR